MSELAVITGGAGFVGTNLADRLLSEGRPVLVFDNLSRAGVGRNLLWLQERHRGLRVEIADVRDPERVRWAVRQAGTVFHLAAQVAVTTSLTDPAADFEVNARGTLNVLEAARECVQPPAVVFTSTNKVYGNLGDVELRRAGERWEPADPLLRKRGIGEARPLAFHSPYGCSKGAADQYVLDYARTFGVPACVLRMSCIYGTHQQGNEDQGWVAHFVREARAGRPLTVYGDGCQVRDALWVGDLVEALLQAESRMSVLSGQAFNLGGGPEHTTSLRELLSRLGAPYTLAPWRPGDQRWYVSDPRRFGSLTGWKPRVGVDDGVARLQEWLSGCETDVKRLTADLAH